MKEVLHHNPRFDVLCRTVSRGGESVSFYFVQKPNAVCIVPRCQDLILLLDVTRPHLDLRSFEFPGGRIEKGESSLDSAKRELVEETGFSSSDWREVATVFPLPSLTTETVTGFIAELHPSALAQKLSIEGHEGINRAFWVSTNELRDLVRGGKLSCAVDGYFALLVGDDKRP